MLNIYIHHIHLNPKCLNTLSSLLNISNSKGIEMNLKSCLFVLKDSCLEFVYL